jgi:hypothetical protein
VSKAKKCGSEKCKERRYRLEQLLREVEHNTSAIARVLVEQSRFMIKAIEEYEDIDS